MLISLIPRPIRWVVRFCYFCNPCIFLTSLHSTCKSVKISLKQTESDIQVILTKSLANICMCVCTYVCMRASVCVCKWVIFILYMQCEMEIMKSAIPWIPLSGLKLVNWLGKRFLKHSGLLPPAVLGLQCRRMQLDLASFGSLGINLLGQIAPLFQNCLHSSTACKLRWTTCSCMQRWSTVSTKVHYCMQHSFPLPFWFSSVYIYSSSPFRKDCGTGLCFVSQKRIHKYVHNGSNMQVQIPTRESCLVKIAWHCLCGDTYILLAIITIQHWYS